MRGPADDRVTCAMCARYDGEEYEYRTAGKIILLEGRCLAARPPMGTVADVRRRCEYYNARPGDPDQRKGVERWPDMCEVPGGVARRPYPPREKR